MPELPEVETVKRGLAKLLPGKAVKAVWHDWPGSNPGEYVCYCADHRSGSVVTFSRQHNKAMSPQKNSRLTQPNGRLATQQLHPAYSRSFPNSQADVDEFLVGAKIIEVKRRAKVLLIELDTKYSLVIHLKMTGQLVFVANDDTLRFGAGHPSGSLVGSLPDKSTRVIFDFGDSKLYFNDQRKFGWVRLIPTTEVPNIDFFKKVGPEPLAADFKLANFKQRLMRRKNSSIKPVLLDQAVVAGIGNIYADEGLWGARLHPATLVRDISPHKLKRLYESLREVMELSIEKGGSSDRNYVDAEGKKGSYLSFANVFRREDKPCPHCGTSIIKTRLAGRGTHLCPKCQKEPQK